MQIASLRVPARPKWHPLVLAILCGMGLTADLHAVEPPTGRVRLESGRVVDYTIHFNRNSLSDSVRLDNSLIALTSSGTLIRFDLPDIRLVRERVDTEEVTCLGRGEGGTVLAGLGDGRVCRVDPVTLNLTDVAKLSAAPRWIGWAKAGGNRPAGLVVVTRLSKLVNRDDWLGKMPYSVVNDLATGKTFSLEDEATTFLIDRAGRLWLGADKGEWGGRVTRIDLAKGTVESIKPPPSRKPDDEAYWRGVYGFVERPDGQVWAFGGTSHMGLNSGYVTRIDGAEPRPLFACESHVMAEKEPDPNQPQMPITQIVEENNGLLIFSYSDVFRVDKELKSWKKATFLEIQYRWGRPDAVGAYASVRVIHPPTREGEPLILATIGDGYVLLEGAKATSHAIPGQLGASGVSRVENTSEGFLFFENDDRLPPWILTANGWKVASLAPPVEIDPANPAAALEKGDETWYETCVLVGPGGAIYTVSGTGVSTGTRTTARRVDGKTVRLGRETSSLFPSSSFITADGTLWNTFEDLKRFQNGRWETVAEMGEGKTPHNVTPINTNGPPWLLLDRFLDHRLWQLTHDAQGRNPRLTQVEIREGDKSLKVADAIPWLTGTLVLATDAGLRVYDPSTQKLTKLDLAGSPQPVTAMARDGLGRLWLGGENGLWMAEVDGKTLESFDRVPMIGRNEVEALAPDPYHKNGLIVALGARGVVFLRALPKP